MINKALAFLLALGIGLIAAPSIFQMWKRAPLGAEMIEEFSPFMTRHTVDEFTGHLETIGIAHDEASGSLRQSLNLSESEFASAYPDTAQFGARWPDIEQDMGGMLRTMDANLDNFEAVNALPPFDLFPWFFVAPGLIIAGLAFGALKRQSKAGTYLALLSIVGIGLIAAPFIFKMFTRAPLGGQMIDDFAAFMTTDEVSQVQQYFLVIGGGEGELRNSVKPRVLDSLDLDDAEYAARFPGIEGLHHNFVQISFHMAPMIGAMSDNVDNYQAVAALPPFPLFPWFFVLPGGIVVMLSLLALSSHRKTHRGTPSITTTPHDAPVISDPSEGG